MPEHRVVVSCSLCPEHWVVSRCNSLKGARSVRAVPTPLLCAPEPFRGLAALCTPALSTAPKTRRLAVVMPRTKVPGTAMSGTEGVKDSSRVLDHSVEAKERSTATANTATECYVLHSNKWCDKECCMWWVLLLLLPFVHFTLPRRAHC